MRSRVFYFTLGVLCFLLAIAILLLATQFETDTALADEPDITPTVDPFPRPTDYDIIVAEEIFENGRMFYIQMAGRIWVMFNDEDDNAGTWVAYEDTWNEGMPEFDPAIIPPDGLRQPMRGFGKLWRDNEAIREALGWALDPEFGHLTHYTFEPGDTVETDDGAIVILPGTHTLRSWYGGLFIFDEAEGTWMRDPNSILPPEPEVTEAPEPEVTEAPEATVEPHD